MILLKLFLAHIIGDFFLQPASWIKEKESKSWRSIRLFFHVIVHFVLVLILLWDFSYWNIALIIAISHYFIDAIKLSNQTEDSYTAWFFTDQLLHFGVIAGVWLYIQNDIAIPSLSGHFWIIVTAIAVLIKPSSYAIQQIMRRWSEQISTGKSDSLQGAGEYIGILERLFIFVSVVTGHLQLIGFLLAAKSVFRFGDLTRSKDRKLTEYILVGTLLSFVIAIAVGMVSRHFLV